MSTIGGIGSSAAALSSLLSSAGISTASNTGTNQASTSPASQPGDLAGQPGDLVASLQRDIDYAFKNGKSLDDIGRWLNQRVSATLRNHGVGDDQRQAVLDQLRQIFAEGGSKTDVRQSVDWYMQQVASDFDPAGSGQGVDFTA